MVFWDNVACVISFPKCHFFCHILELYPIKILFSSNLIFVADLTQIRAPSDPAPHPLQVSDHNKAKSTKPPRSWL